MRTSSFHKSFTSLLITAPTTKALYNSTTLLNITAIAAINNASVLECWQLATQPQIFLGAVNYLFGNATGGYVGILPPKTYIGQAWSPHAQ